MTERSTQRRLPDLLRERRLELGLPEPAGPWQPMRPLLLRGALIGGAALLVSLGSIVVIGRLESQQQQQLQVLSPFEQRVQLAEGRLRAAKQRGATVRKDNLKIAEQLLAVPAGSPLLVQLGLVTPAGVQLEDVSAQNDLIKVSGKVGLGGQPGPLERVNALQLALERLPISQTNGVKVLKVTRDDGEAPSVRFSLDWSLDATAKPSLQQLQQFGATGLVQRYRLLEQKGVAP
ncbi:pilus assembly protein [Synechococcus sp. UW179A]|uniref:pilus assembly protein n=1 Tax=Synechococcus sp. UW179A TaxID=2575510 RepID=UPI000E0F2FDF|nr:pilus assembly protein [Synechococcus sp. UW179A]